MNKICLYAAAAALLVMADAAASFAAELPIYEAAGLPISPVQARVLEAAHVREQAPAPGSTVTPVQLSVLTPRARTTASIRTVGSGR